MPILHSKVVSRPDGPDTGIARASDWNADHVALLQLEPLDTGASTVSYNPDGTLASEAWTDSRSA